MKNTELTPQQKIQILREIFDAFEILDIADDQFFSMKKEFGGLVELHEEMQDRLLEAEFSQEEILIARNTGFCLTF